MASVKVAVLDEVRARGADLTRYAGSHPMAGRERSGAVAARGDLFDAQTLAARVDLRFCAASSADRIAPPMASRVALTVLGVALLSLTTAVIAQDQAVQEAIIGAMERMSGRRTEE